MDKKDYIDKATNLLAQPAYRTINRDKSLVWCESLQIHLVYLCNTLSHFWHPLVGSRLQHSPNIEEENPRSGLAVGAVAEL